MKKTIIDILSYLNMLALVSFIIGLVVFLFHFFNKGVIVFKYPVRLLIVFGIPILIMLICKFILYKINKSNW